VRQALAIGIDKERLVKNFYLAGSFPATQFVPPGVKPGFTEGYAGPKFDLAKAKQMLTDAGFDFNKEYTLGYADRTRPYFPYPTKLAQDLQAQFADLGIKVKLNMQEFATFLPRTRDGQEELFLLGWSEDYPDATNWYDVFLTGSSKAFGNAFPDIVEKIQKAARMGDAAERQKLYDEVNKLYDEHVPTIILTHGTKAMAFLANVKNVNIGPYNENFTQMETDDGTVVYSSDGEPVSLYCGDETDGSSFRACLQVFETLYNFTYGTSLAKPALAEKCEANADATVWTCTLRQGVKFSNGAKLDAADVVNSFDIMWDYKNPLRKGNTGSFQYFKDFFGPKALNEPAS
jgi:ABC-type transport system substrate-binding protein